MNDFFSRRRQRLLRLKLLREGAAPPPLLAGAPPLVCDACGKQVSRAALAKNWYVCPHCGAHRPIGAYQRLAQLLDHGSFRELEETLTAGDPLQFAGYTEKKQACKQDTALHEAVVTAKGKIEGLPAVFAVMDSRFLMGSMGVAVGEKVARAAETAAKAKLPLIAFCASGGARMQEGILSLMQMAKTAAAVQQFQQAGGLYIVCLTHPTTGGVTASFASLGDITLAEPGALIGFAGPRVIRQTIGEELPDGFQRAEYLQQHGFVDAVVPRAGLRAQLAQLLRLHKKGGARHATAPLAR